ncbi:MAG: sulfatase [Planctomycetota bacterium]
MKNILLFCSDHMRHDALACNGNPFVKTPNLDRLAAGGLNFANSFTPNPICVPARASMTTGNYSHKATGTKDNSGRIHDDQPKLAEHFNQHGYRTYAIGKLHYVPYAPPGEPRLLHGFQYCELCESGRILRKYDPEGKLRGLEDFHDYLCDVGWAGYERAHMIGNNDIHPAPSPLPAKYHEEAWVADRTIAALQRHLDEHPDRPFLAWSSFAKPHSPYDPPRPWDTMYDPRELPEPIGGLSDLEGRDRELTRRPPRYGWDRVSPQAVQVARAHFFGMVSFQDHQVGRVLDFLDEAGLADETIVAYMSDHGDLLGDFGNFFKCSMFDGSAKVPFIWRVPGLADAGETREQLVGPIDLLPTLAGLTGCELEQEVDGEDLAPILAAGDAPGRELFISQTWDRPEQKYMVRTHDWKYVYCEEGGTEELYDVRNDPEERRNLAGDHPDEVDRLRSILIDWCEEQGDDEMVRDGKLAESPVVREEPSFQDRIMGWRWY